MRYDNVLAHFVCFLIDAKNTTPVAWMHTGSHKYDSEHRKNQVSPVLTGCSFMIVLIVLLGLALIALAIVSVINRAQEKEQMRRLQQRKLKIQADALTDIVNCLEETIPNRHLIKYINDEIIGILHRVLLLEKGPAAHIENHIRLTQMHSDELAQGKSHLIPSYQKISDAQITQTQTYLNEAGGVLRQICTQGKMHETELNVYMSELTWAYLMVSVISFIAQGHRFTAISDRMTAYNYYQKAQQLLVESMHPDPRRLRMVKELGEIIDGTRESLSWDLMPEQPLPALQTTPFE